ncbi:auxin-induced in root cultures protein 12 [Carica papaya]|uniref:auxin-induced in root cultures protein 12 n=1 Tax=Carica papaya TaxID=3649 RepID=UPI000B8CA843|nr:auxin-induced in root cultures protein 12 [Carica papaya]
MASLSSSLAPILLCVTLWISLISPGRSLRCSSQQLSAKNESVPKFANCIDLPSLDAFLHYTYNASNSSLSVAFVATPPSPDGWIAWAINPTSTGMVGSQALIAFKSDDGKAINVKTYNISSYHDVKESKLSFDVWNMRAESLGKDNSIAIFAVVKVPEKAEKVNQVWQVGSKVSEGQPRAHQMAPANLNARAVLQLEGKRAPSPSSGATAPSPAGGSSASNETGDGGRRIMKNAGLYVALSVFVGSFIIF